MRKNISKRQPAIVMAIDQDARLLDLRVFAAQNKHVEPEVVGNATLRLRDLREVVAFLSHEIQMRDWMDDAQAAARRTRKKKRTIA
jgi:hypothetical protein